jgi:hypothetical protein
MSENIEFPVQKFEGLVKTCEGILSVVKLIYDRVKRDDQYADDMHWEYPETQYMQLENTETQLDDKTPIQIVWCGDNLERVQTYVSWHLARFGYDGSAASYEVEGDKLEITIHLDREDEEPVHRVYTLGKRDVLLYYSEIPVLGFSVIRADERRDKPLCGTPTKREQEIDKDRYDRITWTGTNLLAIQSFVKRQIDSNTPNRPCYQHATSYRVDGGVLEINFTTVKEDGQSRTIVYHMSKGNVLAYDAELAGGTFTVLEVRPEEQEIRTPTSKEQSCLAKKVDEIAWEEFVSQTNLYNFRSISCGVSGDPAVTDFVEKWYDTVLEWIVRPFARNTSPETIKAESVIYRRLDVGERAIIRLSLEVWAREQGGFYAKSETERPVPDQVPADSKVNTDTENKPVEKEEYQFSKKSDFVTWTGNNFREITSFLSRYGCVVFTPEEWSFPEFTPLYCWHDPFMEIVEVVHVSSSNDQVLRVDIFSRDKKEQWIKTNYAVDVKGVIWYDGRGVLRGFSVGNENSTIIKSEIFESWDSLSSEQAKQD